MADMIQGSDVVAAMRRACRAVSEQAGYLTSLDQALGDGDMGITTGKIAAAMLEYTESNEIEDIGKYLGQAGIIANRAGPSTMGTLIATALMRAGRELRGRTELSAADVAAMLTAADQGMQERGKAQPGDKTVIDAIHPAAQTFAAAVQGDVALADAGRQALAAAEAGRDSVTPLRSKVGRAGWVGERTEGKLDPGCALFTIVLAAVLEG